MPVFRVLHERRRIVEARVRSEYHREGNCAKCGEHPRWVWVHYGCNTFEGFNVEEFKNVADTMVVASPEKAGVGGSTPSLATIKSVSVPETWVTERSLRDPSST